MYILILIMVPILILLYLSASYFLLWPFDGWARDELGQFGDSWGMLTCIFSALAFIGVVYSVKIQRDSYNKIRQDSEDGKKNIKIQQFESIFFQMLNLLQSIINDIDIKPVKHDGEYTQERNGRDAFRFFYVKLKNEVSKKTYGKIESDREKDLSEAFRSFYIKRQQDLGHYFRLIYNIYKFIDNSIITSAEKKQYANLLRALISDYELLIIFYNCLGPNGGKFRKYAISYEIFDNIPLEKLFNRNDACFFESNAFGGKRANH